MEKKFVLQASRRVEALAIIGVQQLFGLCRQTNPEPNPQVNVDVVRQSLEPRGCRSMTSIESFDANDGATLTRRSGRTEASADSVQRFKSFLGQSAVSTADSTVSRRRE